MCIPSNIYLLPPDMQDSEENVILEICNIRQQQTMPRYLGYRVQEFL